MTPTQSLCVAALLASVACGSPSDPSAAESEVLDAAESDLSSRPLGSGAVFTRLPATPGFPEGIVVVDNRVFVSGPATLGTAGRGPSQILIFDLATGASRGSIVIQGETLSEEHALSCITVDAKKRLYVLSTQLGVVRLTPKGAGYVQDIYAPLPPNLPMCAPGTSGPCSPTIYDGPPLVNDLAFDYAGNLYVTDSFQATIFRVPPGGGTPKIWFQSPALASVPFGIGVNGLRVSPDHQKVYFTVSNSAANPAEGYVYSVPRVAAPSEASLKVVRKYVQGESPDGIAFGLFGSLYVTLAGSNRIAVLSPTGTETKQYGGPPGSSIPFDAPANIAFNKRGSLLITNHAVLSGNAANFAVIDLFVADLGFPLAAPLVH